MVEIEPEPELFRTFTDHNLACGAIPTTPIELSLPPRYSGDMNSMTIVMIC